MSGDGMEPWQVISLLQGTNSKSEKEDLLAAEMLSGNRELFAGLRWGLSPYHTFGVRQVPPSRNRDHDGDGAGWSEFEGLLESLASRDLTGNAARFAIEGFMERTATPRWNYWYRPILLRDFRAGFTAITVNAVADAVRMPEYRVPAFSCQLAFDANDEKHAPFVRGRKLVETKLDGVRCLAFVGARGGVRLYSRNGKEFTNFPRIVEALESWEAPYDVVLDGEIVSSTFNDLLCHVHRRPDTVSNDAEYYVFDVLGAEEFRCEGLTAGQEERSRTLRSLLSSPPGLVHIVGQEPVDLDTPEGQSRFVELGGAALGGGYEGLVLKDPDARYEFKRTRAWLKVKPFLDADLRVVSLVEGEGKYEGMLGAIACEGEVDGVPVAVSVGSGFTDEQRASIWEGGLEPGTVVEVRADAVSRNQDGTRSLRFPRFRRFRTLGGQTKV